MYNKIIIFLRLFTLQMLAWVLFHSFLCWWLQGC